MPSPKRNIGKTIAVYCGSAWVFIEAFNFLIEQYDLNLSLLDGIILLVIFGLPAAVVYEWFEKKFTMKAVILQSINALIAFSVIGYDFVNPEALNTSELRILKFKSDQRKLAESIESLVVLPFDNLTGIDSIEYFVAGMHESLIGDLGQLSAFTVKSKTTAQAYKNTTKTIPEIGLELGVDAVIEASLMCLGDSMCVQLKLISAYPEEKQLWVKNFYEERSQILNLYRNISKNISEEINIVLTPEEELRLTQKETINPDAYDAYLKAKYFWDQLTPESLQKALQNYQSALELEPTWAYAYAGMAEYWVGLKQFGFVPASYADPLIYDNIKKAITIDSVSEYVRYVNSLIAVWTEWDWEKGEKEFLTVIAKNPNNAYARAYYSHLLTIMGRRKEALVQSKLSIKLDPKNPLIISLHMVVLEDQGKYENCIKIAERAGNHPIANIILDRVYLIQGNLEMSFEHMIKFLSAYFEPEIVTSVEKTYETQGYYAAFDQVFNEYIQRSTQQYIPPGVVITFYRSNQEPKLALDLIQKGKIGRAHV